MTRAWLLGAALAVALAAHAQDTPGPPAPAAPAAPPMTEPAQKVEIRANRSSDTEQRRQSTAAKIVIGRDEIERFGDATVGELLKRLPGVTMPGPPGRGGPPRMRGLGGGYTQLLLDGERVPPGFSLETLSPEQIERIEILRAPTAETGARAIAGTINIITREGFTKRLNDLKLGLEHENGVTRPTLNWVRNLQLDERWNANLSVTAANQDRDTRGHAVTELRNLDTGVVQQRQVQTTFNQERRDHFTLGTRLQWLGEQGQSAMLMPFVVHSRSARRGSGDFQPPEAGAPIAPYDRVLTRGGGSFTLARLQGNWRGRLPEGTRLEARAGAGGWRSRGESGREEFDDAGVLIRTLDEPSRARERSGNLALKANRLLDNDHDLVGGAELERVSRADERQTLEGRPPDFLPTPLPALADFGENLRATSTRTAAWLQDEWKLNAQWAAHAGLRWEQIETRGTQEDGRAAINRNAVWTPLLHAVWKPEPTSRDQVRISLTRSYRAPSVSSLIARPGISQRYPVPGTNLPTYPDRAGNPNLKPELATGIDIAVERYLGAGGVLSANLFARRITNLMRNLILLETPSWSPADPRWVSRPRNVGNATTQGLELEAKFRLTEFWPDAIPLDLRTNASFYRSRVDGVPGPDNRLEQQTPMSLNLGADYRLRSLPLAVGGNLAGSPGYETRMGDSQWARAGRKRVVDLYALWTLAPAMQLRLTASNALPLQSTGTTELEYADPASGARLREINESFNPTWVIWQLRLELKL
jgi:iron complex outermembrane receptor protein